MLNVAGPTELAGYGEADGFTVHVVVSPPELSPQAKFGMICWFSTYVCATGVVSIRIGPNETGGALLPARSWHEAFSVAPATDVFTVSVTVAAEVNAFG